MRSREVATGDTIVVVSADSRVTIATVTVPAAPIEDDAGVVAWPPQSLSVAVPEPDMTPEVARARVRACILFVVSPRVRLFYYRSIDIPHLPPPTADKPGPRVADGGDAGGGLWFAYPPGGGARRRASRPTHLRPGRSWGQRRWGRVMGRGVCFGSFFFITL